MKKSQLCYAIWPWGTDTKEQAELAAKEVSEIGFKNVESVKNSLYAYDLNVEEYQAMLDKYGLKSRSFYFHLPAPGNEGQVFDTLEKELECIKKMGIDIVTLQAVLGRPEGDIMDDKAKEHNLNLTIKFANIAKKYGIRTNVHPHLNTYVMYEDEIDYIMENTDPDLVSLAPDTAHLAGAGADPVAVIKKYIDRVKFTHIKEYKLGDAISSEGWAGSGVPIMSCFRELGQGTVDFAGVMKVLDDANYTGLLCVELDQPSVTNAQSAKENYDFICQFLED